jgi:hypothetical protein
MKFNLQLLAAAAALAVAGHASAALTAGSAPGGSSLVLSVWDSVANVSYTRVLGNNVLNSFLPSGFTTLPGDGTTPGTPTTGDKTPELGLTLNFAGDGLFTTTFAGSNAANIQWNVVAFDSVNSNATTGGYSRVITTATGAPTTLNSGVGGMTQGANNYFNALLSQTNIGNTGVNSAAVTDPGSQAFAGNPNFGPGINGNALQGNSAGTGFGESLSFFYIARSSFTGGNSTPATILQYANSVGGATWSLAADGTATYNVSAVPLPATFWLMASGLVAMGGYMRRRRSQAG